MSFSTPDPVPTDIIAARKALDGECAALAAFEPEENRSAILAAFQDSLDRLQKLAAEFGAIAERARIGAIMNLPSAEGRLALAWAAASAGLSVEAAEEVLRIERLSAALPPVDPGAFLSH